MSTSQVAAPYRTTVPGDIGSYDVEGDLASNEYCAVELDTARARCVKAFAGGIPVGVLMNRPTETGTSTSFSLTAQVQERGHALLKAGSGGIAAGDLVKITTGGVGIKATPSDGDYIFGLCTVGAAEGYAGTVLIRPTYARVT